MAGMPNQMYLFKKKYKMTNNNYIQKNRSTTFKKGDKVMMVNCGEAGFYDKVWECKTDSFLQCGSDLVFLKGYSGAFSTEYLKKMISYYKDENGPYYIEQGNKIYLK